MFKSQNKTQSAQSAVGLQSLSILPAGGLTWRPTLRKMTNRVFSGASKSPARPSRPALLPGWTDDNGAKTLGPNDPSHTTILEHPRGPKEPAYQKLNFSKKSISTRVKDQLSSRGRMRVSKPSIGASSFTHSIASTEYTQMARDNPYPDTDTESSPSSTLLLDLSTPSGNRTSYVSKRPRKDCTNTSILLPAVYQPPVNDGKTYISLDSFPAPPIDTYLSFSNANPRVNSPISFLPPPSRIIHTTATESKELQGLQRLSIAEHPETLALLSSPITHGAEKQKSTEQLNDDFQVFLAKSRFQAKRNSMLSQLNFRPDSEIYSTPRTSKVLDDITAAHNIKKRLSQNPSTVSPPSGMKSPKLRPFSLQATAQPREKFQPAETRSSSPPTFLRPDSQVIPAALHADLPISSSPWPLASHPTQTPHTPTQPHPPATPIHGSHFSVDSRPYHNSASSSIYGKVRDFIFPSRSRPVSGISYSSAANAPYAPVNTTTYPETPQLHTDKRYSALNAGTGSRPGRESRWSRVGRSIKRSLSFERTSESDVVRLEGEHAPARDREDLRGWEREEREGWRGSRIVMPTSRGLDRYNRTVDGGYWM